MIEFYYYSLFLLFSIIVTMMIVDQNVSDYIVILLKLIRIKFERFIWKIRFHPFWFTNPIGQWWMMKKYEKLMKKKNDEV